MPRDLGQPPVASSNVVATARSGSPSLRAREQLVPGAEAGPLAVDHERQLRRARGRPAVRMPSHGRQQLLTGDGGGTARIAAGAAHGGQRLLDQGRVAGAGPAGPRARSSAASSRSPHLGQLGRQLHLRLDLLQRAPRHVPKASRQASMA